MGGGRERTQRKKEGDCLSQFEPETEALRKPRKFSLSLTSAICFILSGCIHGFLSFVVDMTGKTKAYSA